MELNGTIPVGYKGKVYPVKVKVFIPQGYPKEAPMIRIINLDRKHELK
jgi:ubiquitin-protein ligase